MCSWNPPVRWSALLEEFAGIYPLLYEFLYFLDDAWPVGGVSDAEPLAGGVEHLHGGGILADEFVDHEWDEELRLEVLHVLRVAEELLEISLAVLEIVGSEAPHVHADGCVVVNGDPFPVLVLVADGSVDPHDFRSFHDGGEVPLFVFRADAPCHGAVFRERVPHPESYHGIFVGAALGQFGEEFSDDHICVAVVEVVAVDDAERLFDDISRHHDGVVGAPWFDPSLWWCESLGQGVKALEDQFSGDVPLIFAKDFLTELLFEILSDDEDDFSESCFDGIIDGIVHDGFPVRSESIELFETAITATHAGGEQ